MNAFEEDALVLIWDYVKQGEVRLATRMAYVCAMFAKGEAFLEVSFLHTLLIMQHEVYENGTD